MAPLRCVFSVVFGTASCYTNNNQQYHIDSEAGKLSIISSWTLFSISLLLKWYFLSHTKWLTQQTQMSSMEADMFRLESSGWIELSWCWTVYHVSRHCFTYFHPMPPSSSRTIIQVSFHHWDRGWQLPAAQTYPALAASNVVLQKRSMNGAMLDSEDKVDLTKPLKLPYQPSIAVSFWALYAIWFAYCQPQLLLVTVHGTTLWFWVGVFVWSASSCLPKTDTCPLRHCGVEKTHLLWICANSPQSIFTETNNTGFPCKDDKQFNDNRIDCMYIMCNIWLWCTI